MSSLLSYKNEITNAFRVFDVERNGTISSNDLKLILRALGFRATKNEVIRNIMQSYKRRGIQRRTKLSQMDVFDESENNLMKEIDLETVLDIILDPSSSYNRNNSNEDEKRKEQKVNFRLFDVENKGYITISNLKRVIQDLKDCDENILGREFTSLFDDMDDDELKAMIEEFDGDQDGMISEDEFMKIMSQSL